MHKILRKFRSNRNRNPGRRFNECFANNLLVRQRYLRGMHDSRPVEPNLMTKTRQGGLQAAQCLRMLQRLCSTPVRISVRAFKSFVRRQELILGHVRRFLLNNRACAALQPNLSPGSSCLTKCSMLMPALNFCNSPQKMKLSCPRS